MSARQIVPAVIEAINARDEARMSGLMMEDHAFIDSDGSENAVRDTVPAGWTACFSMVPDYRIEAKDILARDDTIAVLGLAEGTFDRNGVLEREFHWRVSAARHAVVSGRRMAIRQLGVNPEPMQRILEKLEAIGRWRTASGRCENSSEAFSRLNPDPRISLRLFRLGCDIKKEVPLCC